MGALLKFLIFIIAAGVMPVLTGLLPVSLLPARSRRIPLVILSGYLLTFALFEVIGLPVLIATPQGDFGLLVRIFTAADIIVILAGMVLCARSGGVQLPRLARKWIRHGRQAESESAAADPEAAVFWIVFALLLGFELFKAYTTASFDGDDAYYVTQSLQTWETGTMYYYVPYTGYTTPLDGRHAMAMLPMWIAYVAKLSGTHPTIVTHSMMPLVLLPAADICCYNAASSLMSGETEARRRRMLPAVMVLLSVLQIFGNTSIYTPETFLLMRTWQGKTVFANLLVPAAFALLFRLLRFRGEESGFIWLMIVVLNAASGFCTSLAPALITAFLMLAAVLAAVLMKRWKLVPQMILACLPNLLYLLLLLRLLGGNATPSWLMFLKGGRLP